MSVETPVPAVGIPVSAPEGLETVTRHREPLTLGLPFPAGLMPTPEHWHLEDPAGEAIACQLRPLSRWRDGSVQWALLDFQANLSEQRSVTYTLRRQRRAVAREAGIVVTESQDGVVIDTGAARFSIRPGDSFPFANVTVNGREVDNPKSSGLRIEDASGSVWAATVAHVAAEERGPVRSAVLLTASLRSEAPGDPPLECFARLHFHARLSTVRVELTMRNARRAEHVGGYWDLGDAGSVLIRDASLLLALPEGSGPAEVRFSATPGDTLTTVQTPFEIYQDSSGGENWKNSNHITRDRVVSTTFQGYRVRLGEDARDGLRATPIVTLARGDASLGVVIRDFWQAFPKAIDAGPDAIAVRLWPGRSAALHEVQGGEQKTHVVHVSFGDDGVDETPLHWCRAPLFASAEPRWYCASGAERYLLDEPHAADSIRRGLIQSAVDGDESFARKREIIDEYGWRNFGDIYGDHETAFHKGPAPLVSHYNNQYDAIAGFGWQFLQTGDRRWWSQMTELAAHVADIDIYHTTLDNAAYSGGMFWHTVHYTDVDTATHRTYPRRAQAGSGGPSCEHSYASGFLLHYFLTGDARSREAVMGLAEWVLNIDDGRKTVLRWLDRGSTGLASASGSFDYHGPGRGAGNSIRTLLDAERVSGQRHFLDKAEELIRRCIHPLDVVDDRRLLDVERRWSYTCFLQVLGRYLDDKLERGELDHMYAYSRQSLLAYARWMATHERPYLERPEILEFPNETWAAQDIRKSDVFMFAARHADTEERAGFVERARFFYEHSTTALAASPHHGRARPTILMLTNGFMYPYSLARALEQAPAPAVLGADFGRPVPFVTQRARAIRTASILLGTSALLYVVLLLALAG